MIKKIILGVVFAGLIGVLVFGAVNRTIAKAGNSENRAERQSGDALVYEGGGGSGDANPQGQGRNRREVTAQPDSALQPDRSRSGSGGNGGNGGNDGSGGNGRGGQGGGEGVQEPLAEVGQTVVLSGTVASVSADDLTLALADGSALVIEGRAWSYARELGFTTAPGNDLTLNGFYDDDGVYEVIAIQDQASGATVTLREASGRPGWAGNGRGGNNSQ